MKSKLKVFACVAALAILLGTGTAIAGDKEKENDIVWHDRNSKTGPDYYEFFKKEGTNSKNYLYTITQVRTTGGLYCTIVTVASETGVQATCLPEVPNPQAFREMDPNAFKDVAPR